MNVSPVPLALRELLRPHVLRVWEAGRAFERLRMAAARHMAEDYAEDMGAFSPADAKNFRRYYAPSNCGTYPAELHLHFGCTVKEFAAATGMTFTLFGDVCRWVPGRDRS